MTEQSKKLLPLRWLVGGVFGLMVYITLVWMIVVEVYVSYGILLAIVTLLLINVVFKQLFSPKIIEYLKSKKR